MTRASTADRKRVLVQFFELRARSPEAFEKCLALLVRLVTKSAAKRIEADERIVKKDRTARSERTKASKKQKRAHRPSAEGIA